jgi:hypothetical protein
MSGARAGDCHQHIDTATPRTFPDAGGGRAARARRCPPEAKLEVNENGGSWNYTKYEIVVEGAATGTTPTITTTTTTPTTTTTTVPTTPSEPSSDSSLEGGSRALKLPGSQRGSTVRGSIKVSQAGSGGRLEVGLFAGASLAKAGHSEQVRVGRLVRSSLKAGSVSFSVPLSAKGKAALRHHRRLALTVKITLTPLHGVAVTVTRGVVVRA